MEYEISCYCEADLRLHVVQGGGIAVLQAQLFMFTVGNNRFVSKPSPPPMIQRLEWQIIEHTMTKQTIICARNIRRQRLQAVNALLLHRKLTSKRKCSTLPKPLKFALTIMRLHSSEKHVTSILGILYSKFLLEFSCFTLHYLPLPCLSCL